MRVATLIMIIGILALVAMVSGGRRQEVMNEPPKSAAAPKSPTRINAERACEMLRSLATPKPTRAEMADCIEREIKIIRELYDDEGNFVERRSTPHRDR